MDLRKDAATRFQQSTARAIHQYRGSFQFPVSLDTVADREPLGSAKCVI